MHHLRTILIWTFSQYLIQTIHAQNHKIDSLKEVLKIAKEDTNKCKTLNKLAGAFIEIPDYTNSLPYAEESLQLSKKLEFKKGEAVARKFLAAIYGYFGAYEKSFEHTINELAIWEKAKDSVMIIQALYHLSFEYTLQKEYRKSLETCQKILATQERGGNKDDISWALWNVGKAYLSLCKDELKRGNKNAADSCYKKVIDNYSRAIKINHELKNDHNIAFFHNALAYLFDKLNLCDDLNLELCYYSIKDDYTDEVEKNYSIALDLYTKENNKLGIADYYSGMGLFYRNRGNLLAAKGDSTAARRWYEKSLSNYLKVLEIARELGFPHGIANYSKEVGLSYLNLKNLIKAKSYLTIAAEGFEKRGFKDGAKESYQLLAEITLQQKDYERSLVFHKKYISYRDSIQGEETMKKLTELKINYETEKKQAENLALKAKNERNQLFHYITIAAIVVLLIVVFLLVKNYSIKSNAHRIQRESELNKQRNDIRQRISNDLHDQIGSGLTTISMLAAKGFEKEAKGEIKDSALFEKINSKSQELTTNLGELIWATNPQNDKLENLISNIRNYTYTYLEDTSIIPKLDLQDTLSNYEINSEAHRNIYLILKEALHNIVKHAAANIVQVEFSADEKKRFCLKIKDDGIGFDLTSFSDKMGKKSMEARVSKLPDANLSITSAPGQGTQIVIEGKLA